MRHAAAADGDSPRTLKVAVAGAAGGVLKQEETLTLPIAAFIIKHPKDDLTALRLSAADIIEDADGFTITVPRSPVTQATHDHHLLFGYLVSYDLD